MIRSILAFIVLAVAVSCSHPEATPGKPLVSVSILPQQYFVEQLAGELVEVNVLIPPGASPATYEPTVSQLRKLEQSEVYFKIGYVGFELSWMDKIVSVNPEMKLVDLSRGIDLIQEPEAQDPHGHTHAGVDPHIWLSVQNARILARNLHEELMMMFPEQSNMLSGRYVRFNSSLDSLDRAISQKLDGLENRCFMIYHPALTYFARDYGLVQYSLEIEGKSPSPAHLREMTDLGQNHHISRILIQNQFDRKNAEVLAREIGAEIVPFDPLDPHWMEQMIYIAEQFNEPSP